MTDKIYTDPLGRKYRAISGDDLIKMFGDLAKGTRDKDEVFYIPLREPDDKLEFPSGPHFSNLHHVVASGTVIHDVNRERAYGPHAPLKIAKTDDGVTAEGAQGCAAIDLHVFDEVDWYGECFGVMQAHGWNGPGGGLAKHIVRYVCEKIDPCAVTKAKLRFHGNWEARIAEQAAVQLLQPLSRLWYAVNMKALYYCHEDDLRFGYLWAEYRMRMRIETNALRGEVVVKSAREGGLARRASTSPLSRKVIAAMEKWVSGGQSIANAARLTFKNGLGASPEANRKLWARNHRK